MPARRPRSRRHGRRPGARDRERPVLHAAADRARRPARDRGGRAARRRPRRRARAGGARRRPERARDRRGARRAARRRRRAAARRSAAPCVRFLVAPAGRPRAVDGVEEASAGRASQASGSTASRASCFGPLRRGADRAGAVLATGGEPRGGRSRGPTRPRERVRFVTAMPKLSSKRPSSSRFQPPAIGEEEIAAVAETLRSGWLTTGPRTAELEARMRRLPRGEARARRLVVHRRAAPLAASRSASAPATR